MNTTTATLPAGLAGKYLTVQLAGEAYGLAALRVREIVRHQPITPFPQMPDYVRGVLSLRGRSIPVIDLRSRFGLPAPVDEHTCIVVARVQVEPDRFVQMGLIVDGVEEVATVAAADLEPTPAFGTRVDTACLLGLARTKGQVRLLLDLDHILAPRPDPVGAVPA